GEATQIPVSTPRPGRSSTPAGSIRSPRLDAELIAEIERGGQVACTRTHAGQRLEIETAGNELEDRGCIVGRVIDVAALRERRDDDRRDARSRSPAVALGRRAVIPEATIFVVGHDDRGARP